jgi:hypothetical protein
MGDVKYNDWDPPTNDELIVLAETVCKYVRFIDPHIVRRIVDDNSMNRDVRIELLKERNVNRPEERYLWEGSPCAFPGVRRHIGRKEIARVKKNRDDVIRRGNAVRLDDNSYPKQIWSFILTGKKFNNHGPDNYSLSHIVDFKDTKTVKEEFEFGSIKPPVYGLFSCPTNTIYVPSGMTSLTDHNPFLRELLYIIAQRLYEDGECKLLPPEMNNRRTGVDDDTVQRCLALCRKNLVTGSDDRINAFMEYRNAQINKMLRD